MIESDFIRAVEPVTKLFEKIGIPYYIGGSIASSILGLSRTTMDVDIVSAITLDKIDDIYKDLRDKYYIDKEMISEAIKNHSSFNIIHFESMFKIDIFILKDRDYDKECFLRKTRDNLKIGENKLEIFISSPEDIILNKLEWFKSGFEASERQLKDVKGVMKVQGKNLDFEYLKKWSLKLGINNLLEKALKETEK